MSDFLSDFSGDNYEKTRQEKKLTKETNKKRAENQPRKKMQEHTNEKKTNISEEKPIPIGPINASIRNIPEESKDKLDSTEHSKDIRTSKEGIYSKNKRDASKGKSNFIEPNPEELIEKDTTYQKKRRRKYLLIVFLSVLILVGISYLYYEYTHVKVPNFEGKELSEVRVWSTENGINLNVSQKYNFEKPINEIISQNIKNKKMKKGNELKVDASLGPNPDEELPLPDFKAMKLQEAQQWIKDKKADNLKIIEEYSDKIPASSYSKFEMTTKDVVPEKYKRKDKANLYYSKGKETYQKNISMSDFISKTKEEAVEWAKKNEVTLKIDESDSDTIEAGKVISQSIPKETMVAKKDAFTINVSKGKAIVMPDFSQIAQEEVQTAAPEITVQVKQVYNDTIPYGRFIKQSVEPGQKFVGKDAKPVIEVTYSIGKIYIKDLRDNTLEGDLQKIFYEDYQSKGANVTYQVYYLDSSVTKGTVINMSNYNEFVPINCVIKIGVSKGNISPNDRKSAD